MLKIPPDFNPQDLLKMMQASGDNPNLQVIRLQRGQSQMQYLLWVQGQMLRSEKNESLNVLPNPVRVQGFIPAKWTSAGNFTPTADLNEARGYESIVDAIETAKWLAQANWTVVIMGTIQ